MTQPHREFNNDRIPLGYLITFRAFGTWLHGDSRGSVDRFHNRYGSPPISPNRRWRQYNEHALKRPPVKLTAKRRAAIEAAIRETCKIRQWKLWAMNVRPNPRSLSGDRKLWSGDSSKFSQGQRNTPNEGVRLLANRQNPLG